MGHAEALLTTLTALSSSLRLAFKTISRCLEEETFGIVWVLGGLQDGSAKMGGVANGEVLAFGGVEV